MPVCLTGDVHHQSLGTADQRVLDPSEPDTALRYAKIVERYGLQTTLFVTGRTADEDRKTVRRLGAFDCVEIGGHNYGAFTIPGIPRSELLFKGYRRLFDTNCPKWVQRRGIRKTRARLEAVVGEDVVSWRDHGFNYDRHTHNLLAAEGVQYVSDKRTPDREQPYAVSTASGQLLELPVNVPPDHDHIRHGTVDPPDGWSDPFSGDVYAGEEWLNRVLRRVEEIDRAGGVATVLAHPACMALVEDFDVFERLCDALSAYPTIQMQETDQFA
jgi:peptidoglycan/xylan/chitin deacetylase (PgdA/CDA1 family)